jgi:hypothetical protein
MEDLSNERKKTDEGKNDFLIEAVTLDNAGKLRKFFRTLFPMLLIVILLTVLYVTLVKYNRTTTLVALFILAFLLLCSLIVLIFVKKKRIPGMIAVLLIIPLVALSLSFKKHETSRFTFLKYNETARILKKTGAAISDYIFRDGKSHIVKSLREIFPAPVIATDSWGNEIHYIYGIKGEGTFAIGSGGSDGKFIGFNQKGKYHWKGILTGKDIIMEWDSYGEFTFAWEGF